MGDDKVLPGMIERDICPGQLRPAAERSEAATLIRAIEDREGRRALHSRALGTAEVTMDRREGEEVTLPLRAMRSGDLAVVGIPFEVLVEIGLGLKERSPFGVTDRHRPCQGAAWLSADACAA